MSIACEYKEGWDALLRALNDLNVPPTKYIESLEEMIGALEVLKDAAKEMEAEAREK